MKKIRNFYTDLTQDSIYNTRRYAGLLNIDSGVNMVKSALNKSAGQIKKVKFDSIEDFIFKRK